MKNEDVAYSNVSVQNHFNFFNIFNTAYLNEQMFQSDGSFGIFRLLGRNGGYGVSDIVYLLNSDPLFCVAV